MNANELADWLDNTIDSEDWGELAKYYKWCKENVAPMLRQQQAEIEALKKRYGLKIVDMCLRTDEQGRVLPQREIE